MINLENTYIETKDKELVNAYLEECERQGVNWCCGGDNATDWTGIQDLLGRTISCNGRLLNNDTMVPYPKGYRKITLADLKPIENTARHCEDAPEIFGRIAEPYPELKPKRTKESTAVDTLEHLGYTWNGSELWKPPVAEAPDYIKPKKTKVEYVKCEFEYFWQCAKEFAEPSEFYRYNEFGEYTVIGRLEALLSNYKSGTIYRKVEAEITWQDEIIEQWDDGVTLDTTVRDLMDINEQAIIAISHLIHYLTK